VCGAELIAQLLAADFHVIMRPHYQTQRLSPGLIKSLRERFEADLRFEYIGQMGETNSILRSDLLISDWSAMAQEYALGLEKPVLFIDVPRRVRNPDWQKLGIEPIESAIREHIGTIVSPAHIHDVPAAIRQLLERSDDFNERMKKMREQQVFRLGHSIPDGAAEIIRLADLGAASRLKRGEHGG
jgi:YidC/Oxa1 family membrane protein insertase